MPTTRLVGCLLVSLLVSVPGPARSALRAELFVSSPILGIATTVPSQQGPVGPLVETFDQVVVQGPSAAGSGEAHASSEVDYGLFRLVAQLDVTAGDFDSFAISIDGGTRATGVSTDVVTIDASGLTGMTGSFVAIVDLDGSFDASGVGEDSPFTSSATADVLLTVSVGVPSVQRFANCSASEGTGLQCSGDTLGVQVLPALSFTFGTPFELTVRADATTFNRTVPNGATAAESSFAAGVHWLGFQQLRDGGGAPLATYSLSSVSGTDWSQPVPEPDRDLAGISALAALACATTRRRGWTTR